MRLAQFLVRVQFDPAFMVNPSMNICPARWKAMLRWWEARLRAGDLEDSIRDNTE